LLENNQRHVIKKIDDEVFYAINGTLVRSFNNTSLYGSKAGFINYGSQKILLQGFEVKQDFPEEDLLSLIYKHFKDDSDGNEKYIESNWKGNGTGFFIDKNGYIATNYHVVEGANEIEIEFTRNGLKESYPAKIIQTDTQNDISIIKIYSSEFNSFIKLPYNFKTNISDVGSNVFALGYPMALTTMGTEIKFTDGKISSKTGYQGDITTYQTTTPIQPGNSGGPLFDYDGNIIGINSAILRPDVADNVSYSIKSSYLKNLIDVLDYNLSLPKDSLIANKTLTEKIKILSDYVVLIKVK